MTGAAESAKGTTWAAEWCTTVVSLGPAMTVLAANGAVNQAACGAATNGTTPP